MEWVDGAQRGSSAESIHSLVCRGDPGQNSDREGGSRGQPRAATTLLLSLALATSRTDWSSSGFCSQFTSTSQSWSCQ